MLRTNAGQVGYGVHLSSMRETGMPGRAARTINNVRQVSPDVYNMVNQSAVFEFGNMKLAKPCVGDLVEIWRWEQVRYDECRVITASDKLQKVRFTNGTVELVAFDNETWRPKRRRADSLAKSGSSKTGLNSSAVDSLQEQLNRLSIHTETEFIRSRHSVAGDRFSSSS